jgi:hypothetical protein
MKPCTGSRSRKTVHRKQRAGSFAPETLPMRPLRNSHAGSLAPEDACRKLRAESRKPRASNRKPCSGAPWGMHWRTDIPACPLLPEAQLEAAAGQEPQRVQMQCNRMSLGNGCAKQSRARRRACARGGASRTLAPPPAAPAPSPPRAPPPHARPADKGTEKPSGAAGAVEAADQATEEAQVSGPSRRAPALRGGACPSGLLERRAAAADLSGPRRRPARASFAAAARVWPAVVARGGDKAVTVETVYHATGAAARSLGHVMSPCGHGRGRLGHRLDNMETVYDTALQTHGNL